MATKYGQHIKLIDAFEESSIGNCAVLDSINHTKFYLGCVQAIAKEKYNGHLDGVYQGASGAVDSAIKVLKLDTEGLINSEHFINKVAAEIEKTKELLYPTLNHPENYPSICEEIDTHITALHEAHEKLKATRPAPATETVSNTATKKLHPALTNTH